VPKIRSFDVFDTLFGRRYINNDAVLATMQEIYKIDNFMSNRKSADTGNRNLKQIYQTMVDVGHIPANMEDILHAAEVAIEKNYIFPIKENIQQVRDGDLLVSDMYMQATDILSLVRSVGMNKQVSIYQSNGDKASGSFWAKMKGQLDIEYHLGDNEHSDVNIPLSYGFNGRHYSNISELTFNEQFLLNNELKQLGLMMREIRLSNYEPEYNAFFHVANQQNFLLIFVLCETLYRKYGNRPITFLGRDCQLLHKIYNEYYNVRSYYLPFSREVAQKQTKESVEYLKSNTFHDSVLVDISSTGKTWELICKNHPFNVEVIIYSDLYWYSKEKPVLPSTFSYIHQNSKIGPTSIILEIFNCGNHGKLQRIDMINDVAIGVYGESELPKEVVDVIHKPFDNAVELHKKNQYPKIREELTNVSDEELTSISSILLINISNMSRNTFNVNGVMDEFDKKEALYLNNISN